MITSSVWHHQLGLFRLFLAPCLEMISEVWFLVKVSVELHIHTTTEPFINPTVNTFNVQEEVNSSVVFGSNI